MAKKSKTESEVEFQRGRIKELEKINKALRRRLRQLEKHQHNYEPVEIDEDQRNDEGLYEVAQDNMCPGCGKSKLGILDLNIRKYLVCQLCGYRALKND